MLRRSGPEPVVARTGLLLRHPELVLGLLLELVLRLVLLLLRLVLLLRRRRPLVLLTLLRRLRLPVLRLLGHAPRVRGRLLTGLLLRLGRTPLVLRLLPVLGLPAELLAGSLAGSLARRLAGLRLAGLRLAWRLAVLGLPVLGRGAPRVRLLGRLLLRRSPRVLRLAGLARRPRRLVRSMGLGRLLLELVRLRRLLERLAVLGRCPELLAAVGALLLWVPLPLLVVVPARPLLPVGAATDTRQVRPAAHAEQIARLERLVTDRTVQGRHDTSPERTPARSSLDVR